jgi:2-dehydro-3-deoxygluconokinase
MDSPFDVCCVGETMVLLTPDPPGPLAGAGLLRRAIGGAESNVASHLAKLGLRAGWVSRLGTDPFGRYVLADLIAAGVDCSLVEVDPDAPTGVCFTDPGAGVHYYRRGSAASRMDRSMWAAVAAVGARYVHVSGMTAALSHSCAGLLEDLLAEHPVPGALVSFDVNYRPALWSPGRAGPILADLANCADLAFVGLDEAGTLWGCGTAAEVRAVLHTTPVVVVKDAGVGAPAFGPAGSVFVPAPPVTVVEPAGAGDAFAAGYLFGAVHEVDQAARLAIGHQLAAVTMGTAGGMGTPPGPGTLLGAYGDGRDRADAGRVHDG